MGFVKEFKEFAMKGNLVDIAVAFVMGVAFNKVTTAFIDGMVMPVVGQLTAGQDFSKMKYVMQQAVTDAAGVVTTPEVSIKYGDFITQIINFIIVALVMFMVIKGINKMKRAEAAAPAVPAPPSAQEVLLTEIRDLLKK